MHKHVLLLQGLPKQDFITVIENLASGLEWFHARGIMFGDLKPVWSSDGLEQRTHTDPSSALTRL